MTIGDWVVTAAAILAVGGGAVGWMYRAAHARERSGRIEAYLRREKEAGQDDGRRSAEHLMAKLGMTKGQVLDACRRSPAIVRLATTASFPGAIFADSPIFEYARLGARG